MPGNLYFDNAASCRPFDWALDCFSEAAKLTFANQEAAGALGVQAAKTVKDASARLASVLSPGAGVLWCNSGTEAIAAAIQSHCISHPGTEIVTTKAEHPALKQAILRFAKFYGLTVRFADIQKNGMLDTDSLISQLGPHTSLFAVHHVNAETGAVQELVTLRTLLNIHAPKALFLADTMQSVCKIPIPWHEAKLDFITLSGCKIGAPCGAALLWRDTPDRRVSKSLHALRGEYHAVGRAVPAAAVTIARVAETLIPDLAERAERISGIRNFLREMIPADTKVIETVSADSASPYILHLIFPEHQGAVLVRILESQGVSVSAGSACMAETQTPSETLSAMGYARKLAFGALRISLWDDNDDAGAEHFKKVFIQALKNY